ncbi:LOW QUALITY PROTEIN: spermatogenesis-associated protein 31D1-like [Molossus nigricans]
MSSGDARHVPAFPFTYSIWEAPGHRCHWTHDGESSVRLNMSTGTSELTSTSSRVILPSGITGPTLCVGLVRRAVLSLREPLSRGCSLSTVPGYRVLSEETDGTADLGLCASVSRGPLRTPSVDLSFLPSILQRLFGGDSAVTFIDPRHLPFLSSDEHDSVQQCSYPMTWEDHLKQKLIQLYWGFPSLHRESLTSAVHVQGDSSTTLIFNSISNASTGQESPVLPYFLPASLPEVQPQLLPQTLPQSQPLPLTQIQPQAHLQSQLPILPPSPTSQIRVYVHRPQNESECLTSSDIQHLEMNVLQKKQESLWVPSVIQNSKTDSCPSASTSPYCRPANVHVSISIDPIEFPLSSQFEIFEHHLRQRLIQQQQGLPHRVHESLSLMRSLSDCSDISDSKSSYGLSQISVYKGQSSKNLHVGLSQPGSFYERASEMFLEEDEGKDEGNSQENDPKDHLLSNSESSSHKDIENISYVMNLSGKNSMMSGQSVNQRQLENVLKVHLSKKFEEISEGQLPGTVHSSRHTIGQTPVQPHTETARSSGPAPGGGGYRLSTCQELSFLQSSAQQRLEAHMTEFRTRMLQGLPPIVRKSIETFKLRDTSPPSLIDPKSSSSTDLVSEVSSESGGFTALRGNSKSPHVDREGPENSATVLNLPLPATPLVDKEGQGTLTNSPSDIRQGLSEELQKILNAKKTLLPVTNSTISKTSERHTPRPNIRPPTLPTVQAGTGHELKDETVNASDRAEILQGTNGEKSEPASMPTVSRETVRAEELDALQSKSSDLLTTSKPVVSQKINVDENKEETTVTTEESPPKMSDSKLSDLQKQLIDELKSKLEKGNHSQAQGQPIDTHHDSDSLTCKASLSPAQDVSTVDTGAVQVLHVHLEDRGVSMEHRQEPWVPKHVLRICEDKRFPSAVKKVSPAGSRSEELGGGDAGLRSGGDAGKLPEQEHSQSKGRPISSAQSRGPVKSRTPFPGRMKVQRVRSDIGKFPEEKQRRRHAVDTTCPQEPLPSAVEFGKAQQKAAVGARAEPVQGHPFRSRTPSCKVTNTKSGRQEAIFAGQSSASSRQTRNKGRHPQKVVALKDQQLCQKHPQSVPRRGTVPRPSPTYRPQAAQGPPAALTTAEGTEFRDQSL